MESLLQVWLEMEEGIPPLDLDGRVFTTADNSENGDAGGATRFFYRQHGARVWAYYCGGRIRFGLLSAVWTQGGRLEMLYEHVSEDGVHRTGRCTAVPEILEGGRVMMHEEWEWTNGDRSKGKSILRQEVP